MLKKIFSMKVAVALMLIFAVAIGTATFIENDYGTETARALVYNARWFEILLGYFTATVIYNIFRFRMWQRKKWGQLTLHLGLVVVAIGAFTTRYFGYEGILHLRNGQTSDRMISDVMMLGVELSEGNETALSYTPLYLSSMGGNRFHRTYRIGDKTVQIALERYIPAAQERVVPDPQGKPIALLKIAAGGSGTEHPLAKGERLDLGSVVLAFDAPAEGEKPTIQIHEENGTLTLHSPFPLTTLSMATRQSSTLPPGTHPLQKRMLYTAGGVSFVLRSFTPKGRVELASAAIKPDNRHPRTLILRIRHGDKEERVRVDGFRSAPGKPAVVDFGDLHVRVNYGPKTIRLPFAIRLDRFELQRYPGSMSPASYSSYVTIVDRERNATFPYHIYMNHVLDYRGFRFFQSSYDTDEQGSVLSVNHDPGTPISYLGYLLLAIGFVWSYLSPAGRFMQLRRKLRTLRAAVPAAFVLLGIWGSVPAHAGGALGSGITPEQNATLHAYSAEHAARFGRLTVQTAGGRMEPVDTLARQVLSKVSRVHSLLGLDPDQTFLAMITSPDIFQKMAFIKVGHPRIVKDLGLPKGAKYAAYDDFFDPKTGAYKLADAVKRANRKRSAERSQYDKELLKVDERLNIVYMTFQGALLRIFPKPHDPNNTWYSPIEAMKSFAPKDAQVVRLLTAGYFRSVVSALKSHDWKPADRALELIERYQRVVGKAVVPSPRRIELEILYNKLDIFNRLVPVYILVGLVLLILSFVHIVRPSFSLKWPVRISLAILALGFVAQTAGMALRWYIAGHAPWSNAYESVVFISWATILAGFVFSRTSPITLAATSILAGIFLFVAHLNWLDPQITNLVPVLKSYWLMIHVAVITSSYGFLGLGALLGMVVLVLFIIRGKQGTPNIDRAIEELTLINEMTLLIGLGLITVGNFLGGVWANESWGRYWSWDPKETWAAVTILVYAAVVHMRFIPRLRGPYAFNVAAVLAYSSVIMTYFGVNYYLSGMHSYAAGDPVPIPAWVYPAVAGVFALIVLAARNRKLERPRQVRASEGRTDRH
ncbi:cytochrome c biogenesis protein CcsA [Nitratifractor sp.]